jgi:two-component system nitrogen regulation response regulator GlnG/two-component system response regulator HydG
MVAVSSDDATTATGAGWRRSGRAGRDQRELLALVVLWCHDEPERVGEVALLAADADAWLLGRGARQANDPAPRLRFARQRAGLSQRMPPLASRGISRQQILLKKRGAAFAIERVGRRNVLVNGESVERAELVAGDTIHVDGELLLMLTKRPSELPRLAHLDETPSFPFGDADGFGMVGESALAWTLRDRIAFVATRTEHALIVGESGVGKELCARAIHAQSNRKAGPLVARNAATLPAGIIDAELFGNVADYPNAGMSEREGVVGAASGGTLFLDEIAELSDALQAHLLRVLDDGEYHRLGEAMPRRADIRVIAATNRGAQSIKADLSARMPLRLELPGLNERREDIPLIARAILRKAASDRTVDPALVDRLARHHYTEHVRELESLLLSALAGSEAGSVGLTREVEARLRVPRAGVEPHELSRERIQEVLDRHGGNQTLAYRELGLSSRDALYRLLKKHGLRARR